MNGVSAAGGMAQAGVDLQQLVDTLSILHVESLVQVVSSVLAARPECAPPVINFSIPDLTYPPSKALLERRGQGVIKSFNPQTGFGFIQCDELHAVFGNDVFLHSRQLNNFGPGAMVSFAVCLNQDNKPQAYDLMPVGCGRGYGKGCGKGGCWDGKGGCWDCKGGFCGGPWDCKGGWDGCGKGGWWGFGGQWDGWGQEPQPHPLHVNACADQMKGKGWPCKGGPGKGGSPAMSELGIVGDGIPAGAMQGKRSYGQMGGQPEEQMSLGQHRGVIMSFNMGNGYGFIGCPDLQKMGYSNDVFLHQQHRGEAKVGDEVLFTVYLNSKGQPQAKNLVPIDGSDPSQAAKRHRIE